MSKVNNRSEIYMEWKKFESQHQPFAIYRDIMGLTLYINTVFIINRGVRYNHFTMVHIINCGEKFYIFIYKWNYLLLQYITVVSLKTKLLHLFHPSLSKQNPNIIVTHLSHMETPNLCSEFFFFEGLSLLHQILANGYLIGSSSQYFMLYCSCFNNLFHNIWTFFLFWLRDGEWKKLRRMKLKWALQTCVKDPKWHPFKINTCLQLSLQPHPPFIVDAIMGHVYFWNILWVDMLLLLLLIKVVCCM